MVIAVAPGLAVRQPQREPVGQPFGNRLDRAVDPSRHVDHRTAFHRVDALAVAGIIDLANVWRMMFLIGGLPIVLAVISALTLRETDTWLRLKAQGAPIRPPSLKARGSTEEPPCPQVRACGTLGLQAQGEPFTASAPPRSPC